MPYRVAEKKIHHLRRPKCIQRPLETPALREASDQQHHRILHHRTATSMGVKKWGVDV